MFTCSTARPSLLPEPLWLFSKNIWEKLKYFFRYYTIKEGHSPINGLYKVVMWLNRPRLVIGNMVQSGGAVRKIWHQAIHTLKNHKIKVERALIVGWPSLMV